VRCKNILRISPFQGPARLEEAVAAFREALKGFTREFGPYWHDIAQHNLARCLASLEQRHKL
jgi:hypothetical protein